PCSGEIVVLGRRESGEPYVRRGLGGRGVQGPFFFFVVVLTPGGAGIPSGGQHPGGVDTLQGGGSCRFVELAGVPRSARGLVQSREQEGHQSSLVAQVRQL